MRASMRLPYDTIWTSAITVSESYVCSIRRMACDHTSLIDICRGEYITACVRSRPYSHGCGSRRFMKRRKDDIAALDGMDHAVLSVERRGDQVAPIWRPSRF